MLKCLSTAQGGRQLFIPCTISYTTYKEPLSFSAPQAKYGIWLDALYN